LQDRREFLFSATPATLSRGPVATFPADGCRRLVEADQDEHARACQAAAEDLGIGTLRRVIDETIGRHVANEERLLSVLTPAEQEKLNALPKKLIAGF
jgi:hypothetical protein